MRYFPREIVSWNFKYERILVGRVDLHRSVFGDAERRKGTFSSQGRADKWQRFKRRNRQRARIFHRREKGGALAALSNCIPTFGEGKGRDGQRRAENARRGAKGGEQPERVVEASRETSYRISCGISGGSRA